MSCAHLKSDITFMDTDLAVLSGFSRPRIVALLPRTATSEFDGADISLPGRGVIQTGALLGLTEANDRSLQPSGYLSIALGGAWRCHEAFLAKRAMHLGHLYSAQPPVLVGVAPKVSPCLLASAWKLWIRL